MGEEIKERKGCEVSEETFKTLLGDEVEDFKVGDNWKLKVLFLDTSRKRIRLRSECGILECQMRFKVES